MKIKIISVILLLLVSTIILPGCTMFSDDNDTNKTYQVSGVINSVYEDPVGEMVIVWSDYSQSRFRLNYGFLSFARDNIGEFVIVTYEIKDTTGYDTWAVKDYQLG